MMNAPKPLCRHCHSDAEVKLRRQLMQNGTALVSWYCLACERWAEYGGNWIAHDKVAEILRPYGKTIAELPVVKDERIPCAICGRLGAEWHHWTPQSLLVVHPEFAPYAARWYEHGILLCKYDHDLWHDLVTPWMPGRGNSRRKPDDY